MQKETLKHTFGRISRQIKPKIGADGETNLCASKRWIRKSMCHNDSVHLCIQSTGETENEHTSTLHSHFMRGNKHSQKYMFNILAVA